MKLELLLFLWGISFCGAVDGDEVDDTGCPKEFYGKCHCGKERYKYWGDGQKLMIVNCTNTNFNTTEMLESLPKNTQVLIFNGNNVPNLDWNVLGIWDEHTKLEVIDFTNNRIRDIPGKSFHKVKNVKRLVLDHNNLMISGANLHRRLLSNFENLVHLHLTNAFTETIDSRWYLSDLKDILLASNMTKLKKLHLEQNEIWRIDDEDMFCALPELNELYLADNQLKSIDFSLDCLKQIRYLDLAFNKIERLSDATLKKIEQVFADDSQNRMLNIKGNPFHCDCYLKNFYRWLKHTNVSLFHKDSIRCYDGLPLSNAGKRILNVKTMECKSEKSSSGRGVTNGLLVTLILLVLLVGLLVIYYHRQALRDTVKPLVVSFQKSMQYSTIEKDDQKEVHEVNV